MVCYVENLLALRDIISIGKNVNHNIFTEAKNGERK